MNGTKFLLDTNILLYLLGDKIDINDLPKGEFLISVITEIELLSYPSLSADEENKIKNLLEKIPIIELNRVIKDKAIEFRRKYSIRLPDAIIAATSFNSETVLLTNDKDFASVKEIKTRTVKLKKRLER